MGKSIVSCRFSLKPQPLTRLKRLASTTPEAFRAVQQRRPQRTGACAALAQGSAGAESARRRNGGSRWSTLIRMKTYGKNGDLVGKTIGKLMKIMISMEKPWEHGDLVVFFLDFMRFTLSLITVKH